MKIFFKIKVNVGRDSWYLVGKEILLKINQIINTKKETYARKANLADFQPKFIILTKFNYFS